MIPLQAPEPTISPLSQKLCPDSRRIDGQSLDEAGSSCSGQETQRPGSLFYLHFFLPPALFAVDDCTDISSEGRATIILIVFLSRGENCGKYEKEMAI